MMTQQLMLEIYDQEQRRDVVYPSVERQVLPRLIRHVDPTGAMSQVLTPIWTRITLTQ